MNKNLFNYDDETTDIVEAEVTKVFKPKPPKKQKKLTVVEMTYDKIQKEQCCADCGYKEITKILVCHHLVPGTQQSRPGRRGRTVIPSVCGCVLTVMLRDITINLLTKLSGTTTILDEPFTPLLPQKNFEAYGVIKVF